MKTLNDFYEEKINPPNDESYVFSKRVEQETMSKYIKPFRLKKLKERWHFREEWLEPEKSASIN